MGIGISLLFLIAVLFFIKKMVEKQLKKLVLFIDKLVFGFFSKKFFEVSFFNWFFKN